MGKTQYKSSLCFLVFDENLFKKNDMPWIQSGKGRNNNIALEGRKRPCVFHFRISDPDVNVRATDILNRGSRFIHKLNYCEDKLR